MESFPAEYSSHELSPVFVPSNARSLIGEAQEQPRSNVPLVMLHAKLVTVLWIIMGLELKSVKPLSLFDTTVSNSLISELFGLFRT